MATPAPDAEPFRQWIITWLSSTLDQSDEDFDPHAPFHEHELDSVARLSLCGELEEVFGLELDPTITWEYPSPLELARHLAQESARIPGAPP